MIHKESFGTVWNEKEIGELFNNQNTVVAIAEEQGNTLGFVIFRLVIDSAEIITIAVTPKSRGQGLGSKLLKKMLENLKEEKAQTVHLEVAEDEGDVIRFYHKHGFQQINVRKAYYQRKNSYVDALCMSLSV